MRLRIAGDTAALPPALSAALAAAAAATAGGTALDLTVAVNYSGRSDIVAAARRLAAQAAAGSLRPEAIDEAAFAAALSGVNGGGVAEPDVIIRTSGEQRLSNFMLWQAAFAELVFCDVLWPDFEEQHLAAALAQFATRQRRFGGRAG